MTTQFEFRLLDLPGVEGQLVADRLIDLVQSLKDLALQVGRTSSGAVRTGRPSRELDRLSRLSIGLAAGSTRVRFARSRDPGALDVVTATEQTFDVRFREVVQGVARDSRPEWVDDPVADSAAGLMASLRRSAPLVELSVDEVSVSTFRPRGLRVDLWAPSVAEPGSDLITLTGVLDRVDLRSHRLRVRDDVGHDYALPRVDDVAAGRLIGSRVVVVGWAQRDPSAGVTQVHGASVRAAPDVLSGRGVQPPVPLEVILGSAPGPQIGALEELSAEESESSLSAMGL